MAFFHYLIRDLVAKKGTKSQLRIKLTYFSIYICVVSCLSNGYPSYVKLFSYHNFTLNPTPCFYWLFTFAIDLGNIWYVNASAFFFSIFNSCAFFVRDKENIWMVTVAFLDKFLGYKYHRYLITRTSTETPKTPYYSYHTSKITEEITSIRTRTLIHGAYNSTLRNNQYMD